MTTNAFRHRPPEQCTLSKEDQQHILRISNNDQELLDELMAILRQLRPLPPRGASVRHTSRCDRRASHSITLLHFLKKPRMGEGRQDHGLAKSGSTSTIAGARPPAPAREPRMAASRPCG